MGKIIAICNQKGGVGKTTTCINLCGYLAYEGIKTIVIDIDPQANATSGLGIDKKGVSVNIYHILIGEEGIEKAILPTKVKNLHIIPSNLDLTGASIELLNLTDRTEKLKKSLSDARRDFTFIFIDTPPSLGILTINALVASDSVIIPIQCEYYSLEGLSQLLETINRVKESLNPSLEIEGVILTMADFRTKLAGEVINEARKFFADKIYNTIIPRNIRLSEAPGFGKLIMDYDNDCAGAKAYKSLLKEFLERNFWVTSELHSNLPGSAQADDGQAESLQEHLPS